MYSQSDIEKKERRHIITISVVVVALILILLVAIIVTATNKSNRTDISKQVNSEYTLDESKESNEDTNTDSKVAETKTTSSTDTKKSETKPVVESTVTTNSVKGMPSTGPEEILPLALILGMGAAYVASAVVAKRQ